MKRDVPLEFLGALAADPSGTADENRARPCWKPQVIALQKSEFPGGLAHLSNLWNGANSIPKCEIWNMMFLSILGDGPGKV